MKIYTKTGDTGETGLFGGGRVRKDHPRTQAYGEVDELNAAIGLAYAHCSHAAVRPLLLEIERDLFALGGQLANPRERSPIKVAKSAIDPARVEELERSIDALEGEIPALKRFILPGGPQGGAALHVARAVCRRAERAVVSLHRAEPLNPVVLQYLNRLSDWLFTAARAENRLAGAEEIEW